MPLGTEIGLSPGVIVLDGGPTPSPRKGAQQSSTVAKRRDGSLGTEVDLVPGHVVLHGDQAPPRKWTQFVYTFQPYFYFRFGRSR